MMLDYINEAFKSLERLTEDVFRADSEGIDELSDFMNSDIDDTEETISIIDMDADTEEDLQDSYIGKIICDCNVCHSHIFKDKDAIIIGEDGSVDIEEECPYCGENNGFVIIGEIQEFNPNTEEEVAEEIPAEEDEVTEEHAEEADEVAEVEEIEEEDILEESLNESVNPFSTSVRKIKKYMKEHPDYRDHYDSFYEMLDDLSMSSAYEIHASYCEDPENATEDEAHKYITDLIEKTELKQYDWGNIKNDTPSRKFATSGSIDKLRKAYPELSFDDNSNFEKSLNESPREFKPHTMKLLRMIGSDLVNDAVEEKLEESFNNVSIETDDQKMTMTSEDNGKVTVTTEPIENTSISGEGEMLAPISDETQAEIIDASAEVSDEESEEDATEAEELPADEEEMDFDFDELDETGMDDLGESYLRRVYENVDSFKTSNVSTSGNKLFIEGMINFKSGVSKKTGFIFEAKEATRDGKVKFIGENTHFCRGKRAFTLNGNIADKKLIVESLTYNYRAKNANGKSTRVYGKVDRSK